MFDINCLFLGEAQASYIEFAFNDPTVTSLTRQTFRSAYNPPIKVHAPT